MKNKVFLSLVSLNVVLLGVLLFGGLGKSAQAQQVMRARGRYGMVSGVVQNVYPGVVYIVDESNQDMVAVSWNETTRDFSGYDYRDLKGDAANNQGNR